MVIPIFLVLVASSAWAGWASPRYWWVVALAVSVCLGAGVFDTVTSGSDTAALGLLVGGFGAFLCASVGYAAHFINRLTAPPGDDQSIKPR